MNQKDFNDTLKQRLIAAGFTQQEQILGTFTAEFKTSLEMLGALGKAEGVPMLALPAMALSRSFSKLLAFASEGMDPHRIVAASEIIQDAAMQRAREKVARRLADEQPAEPHAPDCPHHKESDNALLARLAGLNTSGPVDPKDIN